ncbi:uncharacterized protein [Clytia hemisphaerica]|uniref:uncharacterized protein isoform X3 n=1 Tax=Clytia hemisphaerica TaxID=252671 RepID=UPI0034D7A596
MTGTQRTFRKKVVKVKSTKIRNGRKRTTYVQPFMSSSSQSKYLKNESFSPCISGDEDESSKEDNFVTDSVNKTNDDSKRSKYQTMKEKELGAWDTFSPEVIRKYAEKFDEMLPTICVICETKLLENCVWCKTCGPRTTYCSGCAVKIHKHMPFHCLYEINDDGFHEFQVNYELKSKHTSQCLYAKPRLLTVISETGLHHQCSIYFCECESDLETLLRLDLWPVTPIKPNTVVSIDLLHLFISLQLEGKISFHSFCDGLAWKKGMGNTVLRRYLNRLEKTDTIDQFRNFRRQLLNLRSICEDFTGLEECAACPKEDGSVFYCLDANFGLVLKASASKSKKLAMRSSNLFVPDEDIDSFMVNYDDALKTKDCSNFQAGNNLRSKRKTKKLSVTGIFGMSCRHEFPKLFLNMRHGERLGYAVYLLDRLLEENHDKSLLTHVIYDIACVLKSHLKKKNTFTKYKDFHFGIPVFHSYGHRGDCQVKNSIRRLETFGLMDGELMERLWSYLRSFSKITKEMTPAHRTDLLSDALMHFGSKKMGNIGKYLVFLRNKAIETVNSCESEIKAICSKLTEVKVDEKVIEAWKREEDSVVNKDKRPLQPDAADWRQIYYEKLKTFNRESSLALMSEKVSDVALHQRKAKRQC